MVNLWKGEWILGARLVQVYDVNALSQFSIGLRNDHGIGYPRRVQHLFNESGLLQLLDLVDNEVLVIWCTTKKDTSVTLWPEWKLFLSWL